MAAEIKLGESLETLIETRGFSRARKKICAEVGVSPSALTQYVQGKARPSFDKLLALAAFFGVSLDYLVYGARETARTEVDYGPVVRYIDLALADAQQKNDEHAALYTRIARVLSQRIADAAREVAAQGAASGMLSDEETMLLESFSVETCFTTLHLRDEVRKPLDKPAAMGRFLTTVAHNLSLGRKYRYLLAAEVGNWRPMVTSYVQILEEHLGEGRRALEGCRFRTARAPLLAGCGLYRLQISEFSAQHPVLYERVRASVGEEGWIGYLAAPSDEVHAGTLMDAFHLDHARRTFERLWRGGDPL